MALNANTRKHLARKEAIQNRMDEHEGKVRDAFYQNGGLMHDYGFVGGGSAEAYDAEMRWQEDQPKHKLVGRSNMKAMKEVDRRIKRAEWKEIHRHHGGK